MEQGVGIAQLWVGIASLGVTLIGIGIAIANWQWSARQESSTNKQQLAERVARLEGIYAVLTEGWPWSQGK